MSQIGIKLANHDFFPIIDEAESLPISKKLELTTVKDGQATVQINLFRKYKSEELVFIGSLVLEDLKASPSGDATIDLCLNLDEMRQLEAEVIDRDSGAKQTFSINIDRLAEGSFLANDFDIEDPFQKDDIEETFSSSLGEIDEIDLSFTDIATEEAGEKSEELDVVDSSSFDSLSHVNLVDFDSDSIEEKDDLKDSDFSTAESPTDEFSTNDFSPLDDVSNNESNNQADMDFYDETEVREENIEDSYHPSDEPNTYDDMDESEEKTGFPTWLKIFIVILLFSLLVLVGMLIFKNIWKSKKVTDGQGMALVELEEDSKEDKESEETLSIDSLTTQAPTKQAEPFKQIEEVKKEVVKAESPPEHKVQEAEEKKVKQEVKNVETDAIKKSVRYRVRLGDTLWDLSETFYKTPWKYKKIARYNGIKNPNKIIVGQVITIPAK